MVIQHLDLTPAETNALWDCAAAFREVATEDLDREEDDEISQAFESGFQKLTEVKKMCGQE